MIQYALFLTILKIANSQEFQKSILLPQNLTNFVERDCPAGWQAFQRPRGLYCIRVFSNPVSPQSQAIAQSLCGQMGSRLTGIESIEESAYIEATAASILANTAGAVEIRLWIGMVRNSNCIGDYTDTNCAYPRYAFTWADKYVSNNIMMDFWNTANPNNQNYNQSCVQMSVQQVSGGGTYGRSSYYDDVACENLATITSNTMYACGMPAPIVRFVNAPM